jgi:hypothetical protein
MFQTTFPGLVPLNLRSKTTEYRRRASTQVLFLRKAELAFFSLFRNSDRLAHTFCCSEDPSTALLVPSTAEDPTIWKQVSSGR